MFSALSLVVWAACALAVFAGPNHIFKDGEKIPTFVNKVGPYFNKHETYHYYSLPVCHPSKIVHRSLTLGEVLDGDRMAESLYEINFRVDVPERSLCTMKLTAADIRRFRDIIEDLYYFEIVIDDLPARGFFGQLEERVLPHEHTVYLWTHLHFHLEYHDHNVVAVNVTENMKELILAEPADENTEISVPFTYSVSWSSNNIIPFKSRASFGRTFFPKTLEIHWLSIINSVVLVVLLLGFVAIIVTRTLNKDFARYSQEEDDLELEADSQEDHGWKIIHADVFRFPPFKSLFCSIIGNGVQVLSTVTLIIVMAVVGLFNVHRHGAMNAAGFFVYALTCCIAGFVSTRLYRQMEGQTWAWNIVATSCVFTAPFFIIWSTVNSFAWFHGSTQALPATTIVLLILIWMLIGFPLTVLGGIIGKNTAGNFDAPCRTKNIAREIPAVPLMKSAPMYLIAGGFLPFSAISVELYYVFATVWGREHYALYGILLLVFIILIAVTACISVALTYFQLSSEDYRWWWRSVFSSGFTGVFVFFYAIFYFFMRSNMSGPLQTVQFFGYTILACYVFFLMLGAVGFYSSLVFVRYIYKHLKLD